MKFGDVEMFTDAKVHENMLVSVKEIQGLLKVVKAVIVMCRVLGDVDEVQQHPPTLEVTKTKARGKSANTGVQLCITYEAGAPGHHMLDDPLIELMEDVRGNRKVNVTEGPPHSPRHQLFLTESLEVSL